MLCCTGMLIRYEEGFQLKKLTYISISASSRKEETFDA